MIIVAASDLHGKRPELPKGDILILAGDILPEPDTLDFSRTAARSFQIGVLETYNEWIGSLPFRLKLFVPGNHDWIFEDMPKMCRSALPSCKVLIDERVEWEGIKFWGTPWVPNLPGWAFYKREKQIQEAFDKIPDDTDVLITHAPPYRILDASGSYNYGCKHLERKVMNVAPKLHIFGHIHESHGKRLRIGRTMFVNAACAWIESSPQVIEYVHPV